MPLIRYDTGDIALLRGQPKERCGNRQKIICQVIGRHRKDEVLIGKDGNILNFVAINTHADIFDHIYRFQLVQEEKGRVKINVMPGKGYTETDNRNIYREFKKRFGSSFELEIHETDEFEYTPRGKSKFLIQKINI